VGGGSAPFKYAPGQCCSVDRAAVSLVRRYSIVTSDGIMEQRSNERLNVSLLVGQCRTSSFAVVPCAFGAVIKWTSLATVAE